MILNLSKFATILFSLNYFTADFDSSFNIVIRFAIAFAKVDNVLSSVKLSTDNSLVEKKKVNNVTNKQKRPATEL